MSRPVPAGYPGLPALTMLLACLPLALLALPGCSDGGEGDDTQSSPTPQITPTPTPAPVTHLTVSDSSFDFGSVDLGDDQDRELTLANSGESPISIDPFFPVNPSDQYTLDDSSGAVPSQIPPGGSVALTIRFTPVADGDYPGLLRIDTSDPIQARVEIGLEATGYDPSGVDDDDDGFSIGQGDCNDNSASIHPGAAEPCDGKDNNCDGQIDEQGQSTFYRDTDGDGHGDPQTAFLSCQPGGDAVSDGDDCDDADATVYPGNEERCDDRDNNCDTRIDEGVQSTFYQDRDLDGYGDSASTADACSAPEGYVQLAGDCADDNLEVNPSAEETCDEIDNNCDDQIDEGLETTYYLDADSDGYGDATKFVSACTVPEGYVADSGNPVQHDCDDAHASAYPGAVEVCDQIDNDCNGQIDEGITLTFYKDGDGDGHGNGDIPSRACSAPTGYVVSDDDCNDKDASIYPGATESCDSKDNDCDSQIDEDGLSVFYLDYDTDGHGDPVVTREGCNLPSGYVAKGDDCNDRDSSIYPGATEACNGRDDNCDKQIDEGVQVAWYLDADKDSFGDADSAVQSCSQPAGSYTKTAGDCNDLDKTIYPGASELCDAKDNNCDTRVDEGVQSTFYADADKDGYGDPGASSQACTAPKGTVADNTDCDDTHGDTYPGASELCDGRDNSCDKQIDEGAQTTFYKDADGDGYGVSGSTLQACAAPSGYAAKGGDCNDAAGSTYPGAPEKCDGQDNNCDSQIDEGVKLTYYTDSDKDGYGDPASPAQACSAGSGMVADKTDCDDQDATIHPGATELCDSIDNNCNSQIDEGVKTTYYKDVDGDGYGAATPTTQACSVPTGYASKTGDCNDSIATVYPGAPEVCDGLDNNCNSKADEAGDPGETVWYQDADGDGFGVTGVSTYACSKPTGYAAKAGDCLDSDSSIYPGAFETCDGVDRNCDTYTTSPPAPPTVGSNSTVCGGSSINLTASTIVGATYAWTGPNGFSSSQQNPTISGATSAMAGTYSVVATAGLCVTQKASTTVAVNVVNAAFTSSPGAPQPAAPVTFTPSTTSGASYAWTFASGAPSSSTLQSPTVTWSAVGTYAVGLTVTSSGCSATSSATVQVGNYKNCGEILAAAPTSASGSYTIDPDGTGPGAPLSTWCDMVTNGGGYTRCLNFVNTANEDVTNNTWFDTCVTYDTSTWSHKQVLVKLIDSSSNVVYSAYGSHTNTWTNDQLTSTTSVDSQYYSYNHASMVSLNNGDKLMIPGRNSSNAGCGGSIGNGYAVVIYPTSPNYYSNPKAYIMPYRQYVSPYAGVRSFSGWGMAYEITYNANSFDSCSGVSNAFAGAFEFYVR